MDIESSSSKRTGGRRLVTLRTIAPATGGPVFLKVHRITSGPPGVMVPAPARLPPLLPVGEHKERLWLAYAEALNSDTDRRSPEGYGLFLDELRDLHQRVCGRIFLRRTEAAIRDANAFADRWRLRKHDLIEALNLIEIHDSDQPPHFIALILPVRMIPAPPDVGVTIGLANTPFDYDLCHMSSTQARREVKLRRNRELAEINAAEREWIARGVLRRVPPQHADPKSLLRLARRRVRHVKGWSYREIARAEKLTVSTVTSGLRAWDALEADLK